VRRKDHVRTGLMTCLLLVACSSATGTAKEETVLGLLLKMPEPAPPVETSANASDPDYLLAISHFNDLLGIYYTLFPSVIQPIRDQGIHGQASGDTIRWTYTHEGNARLFVLNVVPGDTIRFWIDHQQYPPAFNRLLTGIHCPAFNSGSLCWNTANSMDWGPSSLGWRLEILYGNQDLIGYNYSLFDSTNGGVTSRQVVY